MVSWSRPACVHSAEWIHYVLHKQSTEDGSHWPRSSPWLFFQCHEAFYCQTLPAECQRVKMLNSFIWLGLSLSFLTLVWLILCLHSRGQWLGAAVAHLQEPALLHRNKSVCDHWRHQKLPGLQRSRLPELRAAISNGYQRVFHRRGWEGRAAAWFSHRGGGLQ